MIRRRGRSTIRGRRIVPARWRRVPRRFISWRGLILRRVVLRRSVILRRLIVRRLITARLVPRSRRRIVRRRRTVGVRGHTFNSRWSLIALPLRRLPRRSRRVPVLLHVSRLLVALRRGRHATAAMVRRRRSHAFIARAGIRGRIRGTSSPVLRLTGVRSSRGRRLESLAISALNASGHAVGASSKGLSVWTIERLAALRRRHGP